MTQQRFDLLTNGFPLIAMLAFAGVWWVADIYAATATLMAAMAAQLVVLKFVRPPLEKTTIALTALVLALGTLTLLFRDKTFIQLKTTIIYGLLAVALPASDYLWKKNLPKLALHKFFDAPDAVWRRVSTVLALYFSALAACNWLVARNLSEGAWVGIKTFGFPAATMVFSLVLVGYLFRYAKAEDGQ